MKKGQLILPVGAGKTRIEAQTAFEMSSRNNSVVVFLAPRISLIHQIINEVWDLKPDHIDFDMFCVCSKPAILNNRYTANQSIYVSTNTNPAVIETAITNSLKSKSIYIFSTFDSYEQVISALNSCKINAGLVIVDEAHNLVPASGGDTRNSKIVTDFPTDRMFFFTATRKVSESIHGLGMNNSDLFGDMIYSIPPKDLIDGGYILSPRYHIVRPDSSKELTELGEFGQSIGAVVGGALEHDKITNGKSRIIVFCESVAAAHEMAESDIIKQMLPRWYIGCISAGRITHNGLPSKNTTRAEVFKTFQNSDKSILFNYDVISEGINLPNTTAILPMRNLSNIKIVQSVGRCLRLDPIDRKNLAENKISLESRTNTKTNWVKPYGYVIFPYLGTSQAESWDRIFTMLKELKSANFDIDVESIIINDTSTAKNGKEKNEDPEVVEELFEFSTIEKVKEFKDKLKHELEEVEKELAKQNSIRINCNQYSNQGNKFNYNVLNFMIATNFKYKNYLEIQKATDTFNLANVSRTTKELFDLYMEGSVDELDASCMKSFNALMLEFSKIKDCSAFSKIGFLTELGNKLPRTIMKKECIGTSEKLVSEILKEISLDEKKTVMDPACGRGSFLIEVKNILLDKNIKENDIFDLLSGYDINERNCWIAQGLLDPEMKHKPIITCIDSLEHDWKNMKFDVVIGNPPYQTPDREGNLWPKFVELGRNLSKDNGIYAMILPSTSMKSGTATNERNRNHFKELINDGHLKVLNAGECSKYFPGVGRCSDYFMYFINDKNYTGKTKVITTSETFDFDMAEMKGAITGTNKLGFSIIRKVFSYKDKMEWAAGSYFIDENHKVDRNKKVDPTITPKILIKGVKRLSPGEYPTAFLIDHTGSELDYTDLKHARWTILPKNSIDASVNSYFQSPVIKFFILNSLFELSIKVDVMSNIPYVDFRKNIDDNYINSLLGLTKEEIDFLNSYKFS